MVVDKGLQLLGNLFGTQQGTGIAALHHAIGATAAMPARDRQLQRRQIAVDIGNFAPGQHGKGVVEFARRALDLLGQGVGNGDVIVGILGPLHQRAVEIGKDSQLRHVLPKNGVKLGHGMALSWSC